ncbi:MAG: hypothetical protein JW893_07540 [Candidatus Omnitrophica bacterium]|nr:hypothetical protein [Candidatus Omnitrophota bacterium]
MATKLGLNLSGISYFYLKQHHDGDEELIFRRRPNQLIDIPEFTPSHYSPLFGVEVEKLSFLGQYNQEGFKVDDNADKFKDIVVLGDSMMEISARNENTFAGLLETMTGLTTANYGMSGFGPHQYLETMKRYGLKRKPKFIVFSFFEGNDLWDIQEYKRWKEGTGDYYGYGLLLEPKWKQYLSVMTDIYHIILKHTDNLNEKIRSLFDPEFKQKLTERKNEEEKGILSHLIVLNLPGRVYPDRFFYESDPRRFYQILDSGEGKIFEEILSEFRDICLKEGIVPIVMFVPMKVHVYGAFATNESGSWWNENRLSQMNARDNVEKAVQALCEKLGLGLISLTQPFQQAAREGQVLFYPFDDHWNSEGRGLAARIVRDYLQSIETG